MSEDLEAVRCALAATRSTLARAEAERDAARAEHAEFLRAHHFDAFEALKAERDRLREALDTLAVRWTREAGDWNKPMGDPAEVHERRVISGTLCRCAGDLCVALDACAALAPDTAKEGA